ncbi:superinfection immunity protein [Candidatus Poriferisodalis sp.]|uniref:superinfection immunity protein n=1 Tax=Candidatus Poriferisodalis sp. TaxID=3101277 RepID=UPI003B01257E
MEGLIVLIVLVGIPLYFLPSIIAFKRAHRQRVAILTLNILLGWTFLGWVGSLVWSLAQDR